MGTLVHMEPTATTFEETTDHAAPAPEQDTAVVTELLVEEISIDGMCGVY